MHLNNFEFLFVALENACLALLSIQLQYTINRKKICKCTKVLALVIVWFYMYSIQFNGICAIYIYIYSYPNVLLGVRNNY